jgi:hypothetical protein
MTGVPSSPGLHQRDLFKATILILLAPTSLYLTVLLLTKPGPPPKPFSYTENLPTRGSSIQIMDVNGPITVTGWNQPTTRLDGTITATGPNATPDQVTIYETNIDGSLTIHPSYPANPGTDTTFTVGLNIHVPTTTSFTIFSIGPSFAAYPSSVELSGVNASQLLVSTLAGDIHVSQVNASRISIDSREGNIRADIGRVQKYGSYILSTLDGSIDFTVSAWGNFTLSARTGNGIIGACPLNGECRPPVGFATCTTDSKTPQQFTADCGGPYSRATIDLSTSTGSIDITRQA